MCCENDPSSSVNNEPIAYLVEPFALSRQIGLGRVENRMEEAKMYALY